MTQISPFKNGLGLMLLMTLFSCQTRTIFQAANSAPIANTRTAASMDEDDQSEAKHRQTFVELMKDPDDRSRGERILEFFNRQRSFFYIAQELVNSFDTRLEELSQKQKSGQTITAEDFQILNEMRFKNLIAWEFSERNLHEMLDLYRLALEARQSKSSPYYRQARIALSGVGKWFQDGWNQGDKAAIILLAQNFEDVNNEVLAENRKAQVPSFSKYTKLSQAEIDAAYKQSGEYAKMRQLQPLDHFMQKKWNDHLENRKQGLADLFSQLYDARTPQALDVLEPDAGPNGHVTGNRFPKGKWAFTFDDGPHPVHTLGMFDNLKTTGTHGTFFWLSQNLVKYPDLAKKAGEYGFSRACHSYTHANLPTLKPAALNHEVNEAMDDFAKVVGAKPTLFRCPYGACGGNGSNIRQLIAGRGALEIFWNVDTLDWQDKNPQSILERAKKQVDLLGRGIILFHDIHPQSVIASKLLIQYIKSNPQLTIAPLKDLIGESRGKPYESP